MLKKLNFIYIFSFESCLYIGDIFSYLWQAFPKITLCVSIMHFGFTGTFQLTKIGKWFSTGIIFVCLNTNNTGLILAKWQQLAKWQLFVYLMMSFRQEKGAMGWLVFFLEFVYVIPAPVVNSQMSLWYRKKMKIVTWKFKLCSTCQTSLNL